MGIVVVGAGLMGAATAWQLARQGEDVTLVEAYEIGHRHGSSHGSSRIYRRAYTDPLYVRLAGRAWDAWQELEADCGETLIRTTGGVDTGTDRDLAGIGDTFRALGVPHEWLDAAEAGRRWPQIRFSGPVLFQPEAGVLDADATVAACVRRAGQLGARVRTGVRVTGVDVSGPAKCTLSTSAGETIEAGTVVVAAGAWLPELGLPVRLPPLQVTQQQIFHLPQRDPDAAWPALIMREGVSLYALPSGRDGGARPAIKVGEHDHGNVTTASTRSGTVDPASRERVLAAVRANLPGLDPVPVAEATCLYTSTPDEDFILDRQGPLVVVSPCSGHGAKFTPLIGALAAGLATGRTAPEPRFALTRLPS